MSSPGVGLVEHGDPRLQHRHLEDLDALLLAAREAVVQIALRELARNLQPLHLGEQLGAELLDRNRVVGPGARLADRVDRAAQERADGDSGDRVRILEREEEALLRALVGAGLGHVLAVEQDLPLGDLVGGVAGDRVGERRLARAVRAHDRVHLARRDGEVDALDDLGAVLEGDVQVLEFQDGHERHGSPTLWRSRFGLGVAASAKLATCQTSEPPRSSLLLLLALLLFGAKRLPEIGRSLGSGMREFKDSVTGAKIDTHTELPAATPDSSATPAPQDREPVA